VRAFASSRLIVTYEDELLSEALSKMLANDISRLPVVKRDDPRTIVGYLGRPGIMAGRLRRHEEEHVRARMDGQATNALGEEIVTIGAETRLKPQRSALVQVSLNPEA
jgi:CBS domain-containing protein